MNICRSCAVVHESSLKPNYQEILSDEMVHIKINGGYSLNSYGNRTVFSVQGAPPKKRRLFQRLANLNKKFHTSEERNFQMANRELHYIASQLEIPTAICQRVFRFYRKAVNARLTAGRSIKSLLVACVFITCNLNSFFRSLKDFSEVTQIPVKKIRKNYHLLLKHFNLKLINRPISFFVSNFCSELKLSYRIKLDAMEVLELFERKKIPKSIHPKGLAAAIIYIVAKKYQIFSINQRILSELSCVSEVTIRNYMRLISRNVDLNGRLFRGSPKQIELEKVLIMSQ